jgi:hypothetical protein
VPTPSPTDPTPYRRARAWAVVASLAVGFSAFRLVHRIVRFLHEGLGPLALVPFLMLAVVLVAGWFGLGRLWRRTMRLRPDEPPAAPDADLPSGPHPAFNGTEAPPTRW